MWDLNAYVFGDAVLVTRLLSQVVLIFGGGAFSVAVKAITLFGILASLLGGLFKDGRPNWSAFTVPVLVIVLGILPRVNLVIEDQNGALSRVDNVPIIAAGPVSFISTIGKGLSDMFTTNLGLDDTAISIQNGHILALRAPQVVEEVLRNDRLNGEVRKFSYSWFSVDLISDSATFVSDCVGFELTKGVGKDLSSRISDDVLTAFEVTADSGVRVNLANSQATTCSELYAAIYAGIGSTEFTNDLENAIDEGYGRYDGDTGIGAQYLGALSNLVGNEQRFYMALVFSLALKKNKSDYTLAGGGGSSNAALEDSINQRRWKNYGTAGMLFETISQTMTFVEAWTLCILPLVALLMVAGASGVKLAVKYFWLLIWVHLWFPTIIITTAILDGQAINAAHAISGIQSFESFMIEMQKLQDVGYLYLSMATMMSMFLIYGSSTVLASGIQRDMTGAQHYDAKKNAPDTFTRGPSETSFGPSHNANPISGYTPNGQTALGVMKFNMDSQRAAGVTRSDAELFVASGQRASLESTSAQTSATASSGTQSSISQANTKSTVSDRSSDISTTTELSFGDGINQTTNNSDSVGLNLLGAVAGTISQAIGSGSGGGGSLSGDVSARAAGNLSYGEISSSAEGTSDQAGLQSGLSERNSVSTRVQEGVRDEKSDSATSGVVDAEQVIDGVTKTEGEQQTHNRSAGNSYTEKMELARGVSTSVEALGWSNHVARDADMMSEIHSTVANAGISSAVDDYMLQKESLLDAAFKGPDKEDAKFAFAAMAVLQGQAGNPFLNQENAAERQEVMNALGDELLYSSTFAAGQSLYDDSRSFDAPDPIRPDLISNVDDIIMDSGFSVQNAKSELNSVQFRGDPQTFYDEMVSKAPAALDMLSNGDLSKTLEMQKGRVLSQFNFDRDEHQSLTQTFKEHGFAGVARNITDSQDQIDRWAARENFKDTFSDASEGGSTSGQALLDSKLESFNRLGVDGSDAVGQYVALTQLEVGANEYLNQLQSEPLRDPNQIASVEAARDEIGGLRSSLVASNSELASERSGGDMDIAAISLMGVGKENAIQEVMPAAQVLGKINERQDALEASRAVSLSPEHYSGASIEGGTRGLLSFISSAEAPEGYDQLYSGSKISTPKPPTEMTVDEISAWQRESVAAQRAAGIDENHRSSAIGAYQIIQDTLAGLKEDMNLSGNELFDENMQDQMAMHLMKEKGWEEFQAGEISAETFGNNIAGVWAGLPKITGNGAGRSVYEGVGSNRATVDKYAFFEAVQNSRS